MAMFKMFPSEGVPASYVSLCSCQLQYVSSQIAEWQWQVRFKRDIILACNRWQVVHNYLSGSV